MPGQIAGRAVELMTQNKDRPFFVTVGFHKPHVPLTAPASYHALYDPGVITTPEPAPNLDDNREWEVRIKVEDEISKVVSDSGS